MRRPWLSYSSLMGWGVAVVVVVALLTDASLSVHRHAAVPPNVVSGVTRRLNAHFPHLHIRSLQRLGTDPVLYTATAKDGERLYTTAAGRIVMVGGNLITAHARQPLLWMPDGTGKLQPHNLDDAYTKALTMMGEARPPNTGTSAPIAPAQPASPAQPSATPAPAVFSGAPVATPAPSAVKGAPGVRLMQGVPVTAAPLPGPLGTNQNTLPLGVRLFDAIPRPGMLVERYGTGARQAIVFADPACPFCQHMEQTLAQLGARANLTLTVIPYPLTLVSKTSGTWELGGTHPQALGMAEYLFCTPNPSHAWHDWMLASATTTWSAWKATHPSASTWSAAHPLRPGCRAALAINIGLAVGTRLGVDSTPTMLMSNGMVWHDAGAPDTTGDKIMQALAYATAHPGASAPRSTP